MAITASSRETPRPRSRSTTPAAKRPRNGAKPLQFTTEQRQRMIEEEAYYRAERRGFTPGAEVEDWLAAETEVDRRLAESAP